MFRSCDEACDESSNSEWSEGQGVYRVEQDGQHLVVVRGSETTDQPYDVVIARAQDERCDDAIDNDLDGYADCNDDDCMDGDSCRNACGVIAPLPMTVTGDTFRAESVAPQALPWCIFDLPRGQREIHFAVELQRGDVLWSRQSGWAAGRAETRLLASCEERPYCIERNVEQRPTYQRIPVPSTGLHTVILSVPDEIFNRPIDEPDFEFQVGVAEPEVCEDGVDNDRDDLLDCDDEDCLDPRICPIVCPDQPSTLPLTLSGDSFLANTHRPALHSGLQDGCGPLAEREHVYTVHLDAGDTLLFNVNGPTPAPGGAAPLMVRVVEDGCTLDATCFLHDATLLDGDTFTASQTGQYGILLGAWGYVTEQDIGSEGGSGMTVLQRDGSYDVEFRLLDSR